MAGSSLWTSSDAVVERFTAIASAEGRLPDALCPASAFG
jgi:hypothetical protein